MRFWTRSIRISLLCIIAAVLSAMALWLYWPASTLSRDEVVRAALRPDGWTPLPPSKITGVKLIHRFDLPSLTGVEGSVAKTNPWDRVWVVVLKGMLIAPSEPSGRPITYTVEVIPDKKPAAIELYDEDGPGDRPAQWDSLIDVAGP